MTTKRAATILAWAILSVLVFFAGVWAGQDAPAEEPRLVEATVLHVRETSEWQDPDTLLELADGRRVNRRGYYGEPGDTFMLETRR